MTNRCALLSAIVLAATTAVSPPLVEISQFLDTPAFLALQRLSDRDLRARFSLPSSCDPSLSAVRDVKGRFHITITCSTRVASDEPPPSANRDGGRR